MTNSVLHADCGTAPIGMRFEPAGDVPRVQVSDRSDALPLVRNAGVEDCGGRGLRLVDALAAEWGVTVYGGSRGKAVFFSLKAGGGR